MSSSASRRRVIRAADGHGEVLVLGDSARRSLATTKAIATTDEMLAAAEARAATIIADARAAAGAELAQAHASAEAVRAEGRELGRQEALAEVRELLELIRRAAAEGGAIRQSVAEEAVPLVARATALATRRLVADYYEADPERTAAVCLEAVRAAVGQEIVSVRVAPLVQEPVRASLGDADRYVVPDEAVAIGGCVIDLRNGTLDASLDARLGLMEMALDHTYEQADPR